MNIADTTVLVLGAGGMVGGAVCRELVACRPRTIILHSLHEAEARATKNQTLEEVERQNLLRPETPIAVALPIEFGNIFVREGLQTLSMAELMGNSTHRQSLLQDLLEDPTSDSDTALFSRFWLYRLITKYKPDIVVDCINTATAIAYTDIYTTARQAQRSLETGAPDVDSIERVLASLYIPGLIRHVQVIFRAMTSVATRMYVKVGTSGTGGMGMNIPYTHGEEKPSRTLLSKSAVAGAHTMLLFLQARTPGAPITKEVKPTAAVGWRSIGCGKVMERGRPIPLQDCTEEQALELNGVLKVDDERFDRRTGQDLEAVYVDMGENGYFALEEFTALTTAGQMEFVTPEEIARVILEEIAGSNTGHDVVNALNHSSLQPSYRAGFLREPALRRMRDLFDGHGRPSVAFEMLGPPRLSKLLFEAWLLAQNFEDMQIVADSDADTLSDTLQRYLLDHAEARRYILSIGIPILLKDGHRLLRGRKVKSPAGKGGVTDFPISDINGWAREGWVDLRPSNMDRWRERCRRIIEETISITLHESSSRFIRTRDFWRRDGKDWQIIPGEVAGWILNVEEHGQRGRE